VLGGVIAVRGPSPLRQVHRNGFVSILAYPVDSVDQRSPEEMEISSLRVVENISVMQRPGDMRESFPGFKVASLKVEDGYWDLPRFCDEFSVRFDCDWDSHRNRSLAQHKRPMLRLGNGIDSGERNIERVRYSVVRDLKSKFPNIFFDSRFGWNKLDIQTRPFLADKRVNLQSYRPERLESHDSSPSSNNRQHPVWNICRGVEFAPLVRLGLGVLLLFAGTSWYLENGKRLALSLVWLGLLSLPYSLRLGAVQDSTPRGTYRLSADFSA
jgi:hypothetical protein